MLDPVRGADGPEYLFIDAGVELIRWCISSGSSIQTCQINTFASCADIPSELKDEAGHYPVHITGHFSRILRNKLQTGHIIMSQAALWSAAAMLADRQQAPVAIFAMSASGYAVVGVDQQGELVDDLLQTNPRCGSGCGLNISRVLRKLNLLPEDVDETLKQFLGDAGAESRRDIPVRADRCGVFASSATISDKNQGIPVDFALATTLKSEVLKACKHITKPLNTICLSGGMFKWQFARDCASDYLSDLGNITIEHDRDGRLIFHGLAQLTGNGSNYSGYQPDSDDQANTAVTYAGFSSIARELTQKNLYKRLDRTREIPAEDLSRELLLTIDAGSTMAKVVLGTESGEPFFRGSYSNAGDTVDTVKAIFRDLLTRCADHLQIKAVGLTGSARYQLQQALLAVYPELFGRISVLVENYAHARGSIELVREHLDLLEQQGVQGLNRDYCILVDVGGEDTKISTIDLQRGDLYDNAMNTKCSAGTGSLLDTLVDLFRLPDIQTAVKEAMTAPRAEAINATCAVFLLEHARRLQAAGRSQSEIIASAVWAIVENMARSLWSQIYLPANTVVLLHGQTMQSDPLPLAISQRLQSFLGGPAYALVPEYPGHRACYGLMNSILGEMQPGSATIALKTFIAQDFSRQIIQCRGAACGDSSASCYRSKLSADDASGQPFSITLGGCSAINESIAARSTGRQQVSDSYRMIWNRQLELLPTSTDPQRLIVPRSFAVSEWAIFFAELFRACDIPVHVDTPTESDILCGQSFFRIDTCAPHIGVVGQLLRLAEQPHGMILAPQIEFLPGKGGSLNRTCTINQGGFAGACGLAQTHVADCRIHLFHIDLKTSDLQLLAHKLFTRLEAVYRHYGITMTFARFHSLVRGAMAKRSTFRTTVADYAADLAEEAVSQGQQIALVMGREYILNPGVFDSHVGRLLRDKGLLGIPGYVLDADCNKEFSHLYWRNAHLMASLADAVAKRRVHQIISHPRLKQVFKDVEESDQLLPLVQVSTFLCGPDSVTNPLINQLIQDRPFLRIQSDAAIKELAHLENRMNTYVQQLTTFGRGQIQLAGEAAFEARLLDVFVSRESLNPDTDVICFPTLADNRPVVGVLQGAGFACLDNYSRDYSLQRLVEIGRSVAGDSVCAPLAAVYGDILLAVQNFQRLKRSDPAFSGKSRLLIFNNKGLGPCRQGQYVESHKLFLHQHAASKTNGDGQDETLLQFLVGHENEGFNTGFPGWIFLRGIRGAILQGVIHQLLADGSARCENEEQYHAFFAAYQALVDRLATLTIQQSLPGSRAERIAGYLKPVPGLYRLGLFVAWKGYAHPFADELRSFHRQWCQRPLISGMIRIHVDGEAYMRTAQIEAIHHTLVKILGPGRFHLTYTPIWSFLEYKLAGMMMRAKEGIKESLAEIRRGGDKAFLKKRKTFLWKKRKRLVSVSATHFFLRSILAAPLYRAAGVIMPEALPRVLAKAKEIIPTRRPGGELIPYVGEVALKLEKGYDLILNIAPEGCMVSSMGEVITPAIYKRFPTAKGKIQPLFSQQGDIDEDKLEQALLQALGPERMYK